MKKSNLTIEYDPEKLKALKLYTTQKGLSLEELVKQELDGLYQKHVPNTVRFFLENRDGEEV